VDIGSGIVCVGVCDRGYDEMKLMSLKILEEMTDAWWDNASRLDNPKASVEATTKILLRHVDNELSDFLTEHKDVGEEVAFEASLFMGRLAKNMGIDIDEDENIKEEYEE